MFVSSGFNSALSGIQKGFESLHQNAEQTVNASSGDAQSQSKLVEAVVGLKTSEIQISASMQVVKTLDDVLGTLLDVQA